MAVTMTSIRLDTNLADEAAKILGVKSRTEAIHFALSEIVALKRTSLTNDRESCRLMADLPHGRGLRLLWPAAEV